MSDEENNVKFTEKEKRDEFEPIIKERKTLAVQEAKTMSMSPEMERLYQEIAKEYADVLVFLKDK